VKGQESTKQTPPSQVKGGKAQQEKMNMVGKDPLPWEQDELDQ
jgi:hypothetical protein